MSPSAVESRPTRRTFWDSGIREGSSRLPLGEERANILLLACCYQEGSNPGPHHHLIHPPGVPGCISDRCHPCQGVGSVHMRSRPDTHRYLRQFINRSFCFTTCPRSSRRYSRYCWKRFSSVRNTFNRPDLMRCKTSQTPLCSESMATSRSSPSSL